MISHLQESTRAVAVLCLSAILAGGCGPASSGRKNYPHKPIKVVVPFAAGGGSDRFVRIMQKAIRDEDILPEPFVIINVPGAGGSVGSRRVKDALADGYTILNLHEAIVTAKYSGITTYGPEAFAPVAATGEAGMMICVSGGSPHRDLAALMERARASPGTVLYGANVGAPSYIIGRRIEAAVPGSAFRYVQTGGGAKRFASLVGGHIDVTAFSIAEYSHFKEGGLRALAFLGAARHPEAPDIATALEQDIDVVASNLQLWWAPRGTPPERIEVLADALAKAMDTPYAREKLAELRIDPVVLRGEALQREIEEREAAVSSVGAAAIGDLPDVPAAVMAALLLAAAFVLFKAWRAAPGDLKTSGRAPERRLGRLVSVVAVSVAYVLAMQSGVLRFPLATLAFVPLLGVIWRRDPRVIPFLVVAGAALGWGCHYLFTQVFVIDLP